MRIAAFALFAGAAVLAGCNSGCRGYCGPVTPQTSPSPSGSLADAKLHIVIPQKVGTNGKRRPMYISPSTAQLAWTLDATVETPVVLTTANPNCSGSPLSCTVNFYVAPGSHTFSFTLEDASGNPLSAATGVTSTLTAGAANTLSVTLGGIAQSFALSSSNGNFVPSPLPITVYGHGAISLTVNALDADKNIIVGNGSLGITASIAPSASPAPPPTLTAGTGNTWTLTSAYVAPSPSIPGAATLVVSATPYPGSGAQTLTQNFNLQFYDPWLYITQKSSGKMTSYNEGGTAQSTTVSSLPTPSAITFSTDTAAPYLYVATVASASPAPVPAISAYNPDGTTATISGTFPNLGTPVALAFDSNLNDVYVVNSSGTALQAFTEQGAATTVITSAPSITGPTGIAFDAKTKDLYVSASNGVTAYKESGAVDIAASAFTGLTSATGVAYDSNLNEVFVLSGSSAVPYPAAGGSAGTSFSTIASPTAITFDPYAKLFFVANATSIAVYSESGTLQTTITSLGAPSGMVIVL